jgi:CRISPR-associated protein Cas1
MKRTLEISTAGVHVSRCERQLVISREGVDLGRVPLEDLGVVVTDTPQLTFSSAALEGIARCGAVLIVCGADHLPTGVFLPLVANTTAAERLRAQVGASLPLQKNIWAALIRAKVRNQAFVLPARTEAEKLVSLVGEVRSGDSANVEARAAQAYWPALFADCGDAVSQQPFRRGREGPPPNNLLNYGYAILRAAVARALCAAGLHPGLGVNHHNRYDPMPLASDAMEPFRPWVDRRVRQLVLAGVRELDRDAKAGLLGVLTDTCKCGHGTGPLAAAIERSASSLAQCILDCAAGGAAPEIATRLLVPSWPALDEPSPFPSSGS